MKDLIAPLIALVLTLVLFLVIALYALHRKSKNGVTESWTLGKSIVVLGLSSLWLLASAVGALLFRPKPTSSIWIICFFALFGASLILTLGMGYWAVKEDVETPET